MSEFEKGLQPEALRKELRNYQLSLGKSFTLKDLMYLKEISARGLVAKGVYALVKAVEDSNATPIQIDELEDWVSDFDDWEDNDEACDC